MQPATVTFTQQQLEERALERPPGYREAVLLVARRINGIYEIAREDVERLRKQYRPQPIPLRDLLTNFREAVAAWAQAGYPVSDEGTINRRLQICQSCEEWKAGLIAGCRKCGCSGLKLWLATSKCPLKNW